MRIFFIINVSTRHFVILSPKFLLKISIKLPSIHSRFFIFLYSLKIFSAIFPFTEYAAHRRKLKKKIQKR
jgi:hypothetical protein